MQKKEREWGSEEEEGCRDGDAVVRSDGGDGGDGGDGLAVEGVMVSQKHGKSSKLLTPLGYLIF